MRGEVGQQCVEDRERVDLDLVGEGDGTLDVEGQFRLIAPRDVQAARATGVQLGPQIFATLLGDRIRPGGSALIVDPVLIHEPGKPGLAFPVGLDIGLQHLLGVMLGNLGNTEPCSRDSFAVVCPVVTAPTRRASSRATRCPDRASRVAVVRPVRPAPTTMVSTCAPGTNSLVGAVGGCASNQIEVMSHGLTRLCLDPANRVVIFRPPRIEPHEHAVRDKNR